MNTTNTHRTTAVAFFRRLALTFCAVLSVAHTLALSQESSAVGERVLQAAAEGADSLRALARDNPRLLNHETLVTLARSFASEGNLEGAEAAVLLAEFAGVDSTLADVLRMTAIAQAAAARHEQADSTISRALRLYESLGDDINCARIFMVRGNIYFSGNRLEDAAAAYSMAYEASEAILPLRMAAALQRGEALLKLRRFDEAEGDFRHAQAATELLGSPRELSVSLVRLAELAHRRGEYDSAQAFARYAVEVARSIPEVEFEAEALLILARSAYIRGDAAVAAAALDSAQSIFQRIGKWNRIGDVLNLQAQIQLESGDARKAGMTARDALLAAEGVNDMQGQANAVKTLANIALYLGDNERAARLLDRAVDLSRSAGDLLTQGNTLTDRAQLAFENGRYDEAEILLEQALHVHEKSGSKLGLANALSLLGETELLTKNHDSAEQSLRRAAVLFSEIGEQTGECNALRSLGRLLTVKGELAEARAFLRRALSPALEFPAGANAAYCLNDLACLHEAAGEHDSAALRHEQAVSLIGSLRSGINTPMERMTWQRRHAAMLQDALRFMAENGRAESAFGINELLRARVLLDRLTERAVDLESEAPYELRRVRDSLETTVSETKTKFFRLPAGELRRREQLSAELVRLGDELEDARRAVRAAVPAQASALQPAPADAATLRGKVLKAGETFLSFHAADSALYAFMLNRSSFKMRRLPVSRERLRTLCRLYLQACKNPSGIPDAADPLSREILHPLLGELPAGDALIISPDADLSTIPFEALSVPAEDAALGNGFLLERNSISYTPSASFLAHQRAGQARRRRSGNLLAFGDPLYEVPGVAPPVASARNTRGGSGPVETDAAAGNPQHALYLRAGGALQPLPGSAKEVETISDLFVREGRTAQTHLREEAREERVKSAPLKDFGYVLFACHGVIGPGYQGLVLTQDPSSTEDGYLTLDEMLSLKFDASLVVLSACRTGEGAFLRGEGPAGLTQAVMSAGADAVVSSLWSVDDEKTTELMARMFSHLLKNRKVPHDALRSAKLEMLKHETTKHPFFWSAFIVYGE